MDVDLPNDVAGDDGNAAHDVTDDGGALHGVVGGILHEEVGLETHEVGLMFFDVSLQLLC